MYTQHSQTCKKHTITDRKKIILQNLTLTNTTNINKLNESISIMNSINIGTVFINSLKDDFDIILQATLSAKKHCILHY